jgi:mannose-6-phosphate isomerase
VKNVTDAAAATIFRLEPTIRHYSWGSHESLAMIRGLTFPTLEPEAELWIGAHDSDPALIADLGPLNQVIANDPKRFLGSLTMEKFGSRLPFLLKVLAIERPLSLQVHPNLDQARAGFADENRRGVEKTSSERTFVDDNHKPELVVAVSDFYAYMGFREIADLTALVELFVASGALCLSDRILNPLKNAAETQGLRDVLEGLLGQPNDAIFVEETIRAAEKIALSDSNYAASAKWLIKIGLLYPARPDVVASLLFNLVHLKPGVARYIAPGQVHAYLGGLVIEIMASSDNVVRGGLTPKRVDVPSFLSMIDWTRGNSFRSEGIESGQITTWTPPVDDFVLSRIKCSGILQWVEVKAPLVLFAIAQGATVFRGAESLDLKQGDSIFVAPGSPISISGSATLWCGSSRVVQ